MEAMSKRLLAVGAHTDDIELGCGGTIARALREGWEVHYLIFSIARESVPDGFPEDALRYEALNAAEDMGVDLQRVEILDLPVRHFPSRRQEVLDHLIRKRDQGFEAVLCPGPCDVHQDHATVHIECIRAFKGVRLLLGYELPWNNSGSSAFEPTVFVRLSNEDLGKKLKAISKFKTQQAIGRPYIAPDFLTSWARFRGVRAGTPIAEGFYLLRALV